MAVRKDYIDEETFSALCEHVASGYSVRSFDFKEHSKSKGRFFYWMSHHATESQRDQYARAIDARTEKHSDDIIEIADSASPEDVQKARLQIDTRKWLMGKLKPKKYGESRTIRGDEDAPITVKTIDAQKLSDSALRELVAASDDAATDA